MKVKTKDFQILKGEHEFEFPVGITVIQGKNGSGKSTLFYAIEDCLTNPSGVDDAINWDAKQASVTIENNDNVITWTKTATSSQYTNEKTGQEFVKASKIDSRDLGDLGFYFDKSDDVVNIHSEWKKIFPFELKDTEMFRLFEDIFNISSSFLVIDDFKKDEQDLNSRIKQTFAQINELTQSKNTIDNILNQIDLQTINEKISTLNTKQNNIIQLKEDYNNLSEKIKYKDISIPEMYDITTLVNKSSYYNQIAQDYNNYDANHKLDINLPEEKCFDLKENIYIKPYNDYLSLKNTIAQYNNELNSLDIEYNKLEEQLKQIKVCPTCGRPLEE